MIFFYPYAFSGVCTGEMAGIRDRLAEFMTFDTEVLAISCDPVYSLRAFADQDGLNFPLLSRLLAARRGDPAYDVFDEKKGCPRRSSYVVDKEGMVRWAVHNAMPEGRDLDEHLKQLPRRGLDRPAGHLSGNWCRWRNSRQPLDAPVYCCACRTAGDPRRQRFDLFHGLGPSGVRGPAASLASLCGLRGRIAQR